MTNVADKIKSLKNKIATRAGLGVLLIVAAAVAMGTIAPIGTAFGWIAIGALVVGIVVLWMAWTPAEELNKLKKSQLAQATGQAQQTSAQPTDPATPAQQTPADPANQAQQTPAQPVAQVDPDDPFAVAEALFAANPGRLTARVIRARKEATEEAMLRADELLSKAEGWEDEVVRAENARRAALARAQARRAAVQPANPAQPGQTNP